MSIKIINKHRRLINIKFSTAILSVMASGEKRNYEVLVDMYFLNI